jgi:hypothetical protein
MSRGVAGSLIPAGRALEVKKDGTVAGAAGSGSGGGGGSGPLKGTPDWWLATLPGQKGVRVVDRTFRSAYSASADFTRLGGLTIPENESLILFRYRFFAELPGTGGRLELAHENEFINLITWRLMDTSNDLLEYSFGDVAQHGFALVHDRLHEGYEPIPLFVHGKTAVGFRYTVITAPSFTVTNVGFYLYGCMVPTKTLDEISKRL